MSNDSIFGFGRVGLTVVGALGVLAMVTSLAPLGHLERAGALSSKVRETLAHNVAPIPDFNSSGYSQRNAAGATTYPNPCVSTSKSGQPIFTVNARSVSCTNFVLMAINRAHRSEGVREMVLPANWYRLSTQRQLFVVTDLERVDRGLPAYLGINSALALSAQRAAVAAQDPAVARGFAFSAMGATWAGASSVLEADYGWMYEDGWGGATSRTSNIDCTSPKARGCWGHREVILGYYTGLACATCEFGAGYALFGRTSASYTDLIEKPAGAPPKMDFTWASNVIPYLNRVHSTTTSSSPTTTERSSITSPG